MEIILVIVGVAVVVHVTRKKQSADAARATLEVVGESHYKSEIRRLLGGAKSRTVEGRLVAEPGNPYDSSAVKVVADGSTVGYIARGDTGAFHRSGGGALAVELTLQDHGRGFYSVVIGEGGRATPAQIEHLEDLLDETGEELIGGGGPERLTGAEASAEIERLRKLRR